jgi:hypothetical protein
MPKTGPAYSPEFRRQMVDLVRAGLRPCLTAAARGALGTPGRDKETALCQPKKETPLALYNPQRKGSRLHADRGSLLRAD